MNGKKAKKLRKKSKQLIEAGLDVIIFSFDGGSKATYEKLRPSRFKKNNFDSVYSNIKNFCDTKKEMNSKFPITKIQMILTEHSRNEVDSFYNLFGNFVDDVTVTQYNERGGKINDLTKEQRVKLEKYLLLREYFPIILAIFSFELTFKNISESLK